MGPVRELGTKIADVNLSEMRHINIHDFHEAKKVIRSSVSKDSLLHYHTWNKEYGSSK